MNHSKATHTSYSLKIIIFSIPFLMGIGIDLYVPSLPRITSYFHSNSHQVQMTIALYMLGYGIGQFILGIASDSFGRRKILLLSGMLFTLMSIAAVFSANITLLNICRFFQGIGIAGLAVVARAIMVDIFTKKHLANALIYFGLSWSLGPILGPFIGGYLQHYFDWQASFYLFAIFGFALTLYAYLTLPETHTQRQKFSIILLKNNFQTLLSSKVFLFTSIIGGIGYSIPVIFNTVGPYLVENLLNYSAIMYGKIALTLGIAYCVGSLTNRYLTRKLMTTTILLIGLVATFLFSLALLLLSYIFNTHLLIIVIPTAIIIFFCGFIVPSTLTKSMSLYPKIAGTSSSLFGFISSTVISLIIFFESHLKMNTLLPMGYTFLIMISIAILLYFITALNPKR